MGALNFTTFTFRGQLIEREPLSRHTSLKVGGPADIFAVPEDKDDLLELVHWLDVRAIPRFVIGSGYNLLVRDGGVRGAVISLERLSRIELIDPSQRLLLAGSGAENLAIVRFAQERRLGGIGFISGIPGTFGYSYARNSVSL